MRAANLYLAPSCVIQLRYAVCTTHIMIVYLAKMAKFVYKNTCPSVANYQSQNVYNKMLLIVEVV